MAKKAKASVRPEKTETHVDTVPPIPTKPTEVSGGAIRILKKSTCPTLSGKSTLSYNIGIDSAGTIHFRVSDNTGGGFYSKEWVALPDIQRAIDERYEGAPISAHSLFPLFRGKSANNGGFLLAVLRAEKLLQPMPGKPRCQELADPTHFLAGIKKLAASKVNLPDEVAAKPKGPRKPTPKAKAVLGKQKPGRKPTGRSAAARP